MYGYCDICEVITEIIKTTQISSKSHRMKIANWERKQIVGSTIETHNPKKMIYFC